MPIDPSIALQAQAPQTNNNLLGMYGSMMGIRQQMLQNQINMAQFQGHQAAGQAISDNTDAQGNVDWGGTTKALSGNPLGIMAMQSIAKDASARQLTMAQLAEKQMQNESTAWDMVTSRLTSHMQDPNLTKDTLVKDFQDLYPTLPQSVQTPFAKMGQAFLSSIPQDASRGDIQGALKRGAVQSSQRKELLDAAIGGQKDFNAGGNQIVGNAPGMGGFNETGTIQNTRTPGEALTQIPLFNNGTLQKGNVLAGSGLPGDQATHYMPSGNQLPLAALGGNSPQGGSPAMAPPPSAPLGLPISGNSPTPASGRLPIAPPPAAPSASSGGFIPSEASLPAQSQLQGRQEAYKDFNDYSNEIANRQQTLTTQYQSLDAMLKAIKAEPNATLDESAHLRSSIAGFFNAIGMPETAKDFQVNKTAYDFLSSLSNDNVIQRISASNPGGKMLARQYETGIETHPMAADSHMTFQALQDIHDFYRRVNAAQQLESSYYAKAAPQNQAALSDMTKNVQNSGQFENEFANWFESPQGKQALALKLKQLYGQ